MNFLTLLLISVVLIGVAIAGIAIKMFLQKNGEFKKQCSVKNPNTGKSMGCSCGGEENTCDNE